MKLVHLVGFIIKETWAIFFNGSEEPAIELFRVHSYTLYKQEEDAPETFIYRVTQEERAKLGGGCSLC